MVARSWTSTAAFLLALAMSSAAAARDEASASTSASVTIQDNAGIAVTGEVIFQDIFLSPQIPMQSLVTSSNLNASVTVMGGDAFSMAVPSSIELTRDGGVETLMVMTTTEGGYSMVNQLQSLLTRDGALSMDIGGTIRVNASDLSPGEYRGLLVLIAQYN